MNILPTGIYVPRYLKCNGDGTILYIPRHLRCAEDGSAFELYNNFIMGVSVGRTIHLYYTFNGHGEADAGPELAELKNNGEGKLFEAEEVYKISDGIIAVYKIKLGGVGQESNSEEKVEAKSVIFR